MKLRVLIHIITFNLLLFSTLLAQDSNHVSVTLKGAMNYETMHKIERLPNNLTELKLNRNWRKFKSNEHTLHKITSIKLLKDNDEFIDSDLFYILVGSAVVFGSTAAYFKLESDKNYDRYLETNNKKLLSKTDRYDLYSGIALGVLEINFGFLIYKFLTD